jgi:Ras-related protein Rab-7A
MGVCQSRDEAGPALTLPSALEAPNLEMGHRCVLLKTVLLGASGVGKTTLLSQYCHAEFTAHYKATIGADFSTKDIEYEGRVITLQIWDTAGQERFQSLGVAFYRGSDCCVLVYDVTDRKSFESLQQWRHEFLVQCAPPDPDRFPFFLFGNKIDLCRTEEGGVGTKQREVSVEEAMQWCKEHGDIPYFEVSAKDCTNLDKAFSFVAANTIAAQDSDEDSVELSL